MLALAFVGMTPAILAESCVRGGTRGHQTVLKTGKSAVEVHSAWLGICVATETGCRMIVLVHYSVRLRARATVKERGTYVAKHKYYRNNFTANEQTNERGGSALYSIQKTSAYKMFVH